MFRGAEFSNTDHRLLISNVKLRLNSRSKPKRTLLDVDAFNDIVKAEAFNEILGSRFRCLNDLEEEESGLVAVLDESSRKVCGVIKKKKFKWLTSDVTAAAIRKVELYGKWIGTRRPQGSGVLTLEQNEQLLPLFCVFGY